MTSSVFRYPVVVLVGTYPINLFEKVSPGLNVTLYNSTVPLPLAEMYSARVSP